MLVLAVIVGVIALAVSGSGDGDTQTAKIGDIEVSFKNIKSNDDRIAFLTSFGWEVGYEAVEIEEVTIPEEFDDVYKQYNELQKGQGLDLSKYKGKDVKRYTYLVSNHPSGETEVHANLLIYKNKIIGGDICSAKYGGFMHGFAS
jgi:hypothetical protein